MPVTPTYDTALPLSNNDVDIPGFRAWMASVESLVNSAGSGDPPSDDGDSLGQVGLAWSDLYLADGALVDWGAGTASISFTGTVGNMYTSDTGFVGDGFLNFGTWTDATGFGSWFGQDARNNTASSGADFYVTRSRETAGARAIVQNGDSLGRFQWYGWDGDSYVVGANIEGIVDGTPGNGDMPTRLSFRVSADGSSTPTARLVVNSDGAVTPGSNDNARLGESGNAWGDLFLASGAIVNFATGDVTITHSANKIDIDGGVVDFGSAPTVNAEPIIYAAGAPAQGDILYRSATAWVRLPAGTSGHFLKTLGAGANPAWAAAPAGGGSATPSDAQGRLSLTSGEPVTVADVTLATTVYYVPYSGRYAPIFDGSAWAMADIGGELSQALSDATKSPAASAANSNYDLFLWNDSGVYRCTRGPAWSSATSRGVGAGTTELERVQGRLVNKVAITNGPAAQRGTYVGTVRTTAANQCEDSATKRLVWNAYNRRRRELSLMIGKDTWVYSTNTWRQVQADATYQFEVVNGLDEDSVEASYIAVVTNSTATARNVRVSMGLDSTTVPNSGKTVFTSSSTTSSLAAQQQAHFRGTVGLGHHYLAAMEKGAGTDTQTWIGDGGATEAQCGLFGSCMA